MQVSIWTVIWKIGQKITLNADYSLHIPSKTKTVPAFSVPFSSLVVLRDQAVRDRGHKCLTQKYGVLLTQNMKDKYQSQKFKQADQ